MVHQALETKEKEYNKKKRNFFQNEINRQKILFYYWKSKYTYKDKLRIKINLTAVQKNKWLDRL